ncbi:uncharacterized protein LOC136043082 isoform X2 [Artemia franciscana]|uniref:uncharacterized protein LOC136043082 isoform X2 n=1 Tax=Artemia franciscana TaxID=6661 RepID=UPI0032D9B2DA
MIMNNKLSGILGKLPQVPDTPKVNKEPLYDGETECIFNKYLSSSIIPTRNLYIHTYRQHGEIFAVAIGLLLSIAYMFLASCCTLTFCQVFDEATGERFKKFSMESFVQPQWDKHLDFLAAGASIVIGLLLSMKLELTSMIRKACCIIAVLLVFVLGLSFGVCTASNEVRQINTNKAENDGSFFRVGHTSWIALACLACVHGKEATSKRKQLLKNFRPLAILSTAFLLSLFFFFCFPNTDRKISSPIHLFSSTGPRFAVLPYALCAIILLAFAATDFSRAAIHQLEYLIKDGLLIKFPVTGNFCKAYGISVVIVSCFTSISCFILPVMMIINASCLLSGLLVIFLCNLVLHSEITPKKAEKPLIPNYNIAGRYKKIETEINDDICKFGLEYGNNKQDQDDRAFEKTKTETKDLKQLSFCNGDLDSFGACDSSIDESLWTYQAEKSIHDRKLSNKTQSIAILLGINFGSIILGIAVQFIFDENVIYSYVFFVLGFAFLFLPIIFALLKPKKMALVCFEPITRLDSQGRRSLLNNRFVIILSAITMTLYWMLAVTLAVSCWLLVTLPFLVGLLLYLKHGPQIHHLNNQMTVRRNRKNVRLSFGLETLSDALSSSHISTITLTHEVM